jgi:type II secretory pathway pseudopilin PulG
MSYRRGFTIVEVMLFLGITGLLALTLLGGWTTMINTQRYKDSVKTVQSFLQSQYNFVYNVENVKQDDGGPFCIVNGSKEPQFVSSGVSRGQSNCIQMGRLISISGGTDISVYPIVGAELPEAATTDAASITARNPRVVTQDLSLSDNELMVPWQAEIVQTAAAGGARQNVAMAIIRSPLTGAVHTYALSADGVNLPDVESMVTTANEREVTLCMDPGTVFSGNRIGVVVRQRASAQSFVQTIQDQALC